jgi:membrane associated rhomboid family serine protease
MFRITESVKHLIIVNVLFFIGTRMIGNGELFFKYFAIYFPENNLFKPWQVVTHMFMHANEGHLFSNMLMLFFFGVSLESFIGKKKFLFLFFSAGLGAAIIPIVIDYIEYYNIMGTLIESGISKEQIVNLYNEGKYNTGWEAILGKEKMSSFLGLLFYNMSLGASGAVMGVLAACGYLFPNSKIILLFPPIPIKMKYFVVGIVGADFISAFLTGTPLLANSNIGYVAHVSGALIGVVMVYIWKKNQFDKYRWN